ncbi:MAG TPA: hypothetical protein VEA15_05945 [Caulobacteraceae bacterium]|nr:hypothetical protein [Caulobacteraceae bacterium]
MLRDEDHLRSAVDTFRRAAVGQSSWQDAMAVLADAGGGAIGNLVGVEDGRLQFLWANDSDPDLWIEIGDAMHTEQMNPRLRLGGAAGVFERVEGHDFGSDEMMRRYPRYAEVCRKFDVGFGPQMNLQRTDTCYVGLAVLRRRREGHGTAADGEAIDALAPHILDAVKLRRTIEDQGALIARDALEAMGVAAFLCDGWGRVRRMTPSAEALVGPGGPLMLKNGGLAFRSEDLTRRLQDVLAAASVDVLAPLRTLAAIVGPGDRLVVEVSPLPITPGLVGFAPRTLVTVRRRRAPPPAALVAEAFDLTQAEAEVAVALAGGETRDSVAALRGVTVETVRSQLKLIFGKMGVSREAELVARIYELS